MQKFLLTLLALFLLSHLQAQKTEYSVALYSGLFSFQGASAEAATAINYSDPAQLGYTNNPYGSKSGIGYGIAGTLKRVSSQQFIAGLSLGYEVLRSKIAIDQVSGYTGTATYEHAASGSAFLNNHFINLSPLFGYRIPVFPLAFELTGCLDIGFCLQAKEKGKAITTDGTVYQTSADRKTIKTDIRPGLQLATSYKKAGLWVRYTSGLTNYRKGYVGGKNECYARLFRFGVAYRLK